MYKTIISNSIANRLEILENKLANTKFESERRIYNEEIFFLKDLFKRSIKKIYVLDYQVNEIYEFHSPKNAHKFICDKLGYTIDIKSISRNKSRKTKVERRFYISDKNSFDFVKFKNKFEVNEKKNYLNNKNSQRWFKNKTRIISNKNTNGTS